MSMDDMSINEIKEAITHYKTRAMNLECCGNCVIEGTIDCLQGILPNGNQWCPSWKNDCKSREMRNVGK